MARFSSLRNGEGAGGSGTNSRRRRRPMDGSWWFVALALVIVAMFVWWGSGWWKSQTPENLAATNSTLASPPGGPGSGEAGTPMGATGPYTTPSGERPVNEGPPSGIYSGTKVREGVPPAGAPTGGGVLVAGPTIGDINAMPAKYLGSSVSFTASIDRIFDARAFTIGTRTSLGQILVFAATPPPKLTAGQKVSVQGEVHLFHADRFAREYGVKLSNLSLLKSFNERPCIVARQVTLPSSARKIGE